MGETKALTLLFAATVIVTTSVCGALMALRVDPSLIAVAFVAVGGTGAHLLSRAVMHYGALEERERREATLLKPR